jgi:AcrR family transcriptional regulator
MRYSAFMARSNAGTKGVPRLEREDQILTIASEVFADDGFAMANIQAIADRAGISKPLIYNYFTSKEGLFLACIDRAGGIVADEIERIANEDSVGIERGMRTLDGMFHVLEDQRHLWRLFYDRSAPTTGPVADAVGHYTERITKLADEGVAELMALSGITDSLDVSAMTAVWMGIVDSLMRWWVEHPDESAAAMTERSGRLLSAILEGAIPGGAQ